MLYCLTGKAFRNVHFIIIYYLMYIGSMHFSLCVLHFSIKKNLKTIIQVLFPQN